MPSPKRRSRDLNSLIRLISQAELTLGTIPTPHPSIARSLELLNAAGKLANDLATVNHAAALGAKGGNATAKRGPEYYAQIAAMRVTRKGGRPKKVSPPNAA